MNTKTRQTNIELLRIIACFAVVFCHVVAEYRYKMDYQDTVWQVSQFYYNLTPFHVPTFFAINGCFLFRSEIDASKIKKKILPLVIILVFWSVVYAAMRLLASNFSIGNPEKLVANFSFLAISAALIKGAYHLWFLYALIGIYLVSPFLDAIRKSGRKWIEYFLILSLLFAFLLPDIFSFFQLTNVATIVERMNIKMVWGYVSYTLLGYYLITYRDNIISKHAKPIFIMMLGLWIANAFLNVYFLSHSNRAYPMTTLIALFTCAIMAFFIECVPVKSKILQMKMGGVPTLGIFLIHPALIYGMTSIGVTYRVFQAYPIIGMVALSIVIYLLSLACSLIMMKIPFLRKVVS